MPSEQPRVQTCLTCGTRVEVVSTDEGTHHYRPAEDERYGPTVATEREQMQALIDQQAKALETADNLARFSLAMDGSGWARANPEQHEAARAYRSTRTERTTDG